MKRMPVLGMVWLACISLGSLPIETACTGSDSGELPKNRVPTQGGSDGAGGSEVPAAGGDESGDPAGAAGIAGEGGESNRVSAMIGVEGGVLVSQDGALMVSVPPTAVAEAFTLTIEPLIGSPPDDWGRAYEIGPAGTQFTAPVTLTFDLAAYGGRAPKGVRLGTLIDGTWVPLSETAVSADGARVIGTTTHLTPYRLIVPHCTSESNCALDRLTHCVSGLGGFGDDACGIPCRSDDDCSSPLQCDEGACVFHYCAADEDCAANRRCKVLQPGVGFCLDRCDNSAPEKSGCTFNQTCYQDCYGGDCPGPNPLLGMCQPTGCSPQTECSEGAVCSWAVGSQLLTWGGQCLPVGMGCSCSDPACPCREHPEGGSAGAGGGGGTSGSAGAGGGGGTSGSAGASSGGAGAGPGCSKCIECTKGVDSAVCYPSVAFCIESCGLPEFRCTKLGCGGAGCCDAVSEACLPGGTVNFCGGNGQACAKCAAGQTCTMQTCKDP